VLKLTEDGLLGSRLDNVLTPHGYLHAPNVIDFFCNGLDPDNVVQERVLAHRERSLLRDHSLGGPTLIKRQHTRGWIIRAPKIFILLGRFSKGRDHGLVQVIALDGPDRTVHIPPIASRKVQSNQR
jgi:hypothetical protein